MEGDDMKQRAFERGSGAITRRGLLRGAAAGSGLGLAALVAAACGGAGGGGEGGSPQAGTNTGPAGTPRRGGRVRVGVQAEPTSLDPQVGTGGGDHTFVWSIFNNIVTYDDKFSPKPELAESWEVVDPTTLRFKLRQGVTFHDGTPFDAEAVKVNVARVVDPATKSTARGQILVVDRVETPDPGTAVLKLKNPSAPLLLNLADRGGMIISPAALQKFGGDIGRNPVGTGAFKFGEWVKDSRVVVRRNEQYWQKDAAGNPLPYLDELIWQVVPEEEVRLSNVDAGQLDVLDGLQAISHVKLKDNNRVTLQRMEGFGTMHLRLNLARPVLNNVNLRRAMAWAIDREAINKTVHLGLTTTGVSPIGPAHQWAFYPDLQKRISLDQNRARAALQAGGMPNGYTLSTETNPADKTPEVVKEQFSKVGITLNLDPQQVATKFYSGNDDSFLTTSFSIRADPDGTMSELYAKDGAYNAAGRLTKGEHLENAELEELLKKAAQTYDIPERAKLYNRAEEIIVMDAHGVFWGWLDKRWAVSTRVQGFVLGAEGKGHYTTAWLRG
jgi:peptide/nickel transport system substrate-binding protein